MGLPGHRLLRPDRRASARPDEFRFLVDRLHQAGIGVIVDWVPAHFPKDEWALARFDGTPLYEHADPRRGEQMDWGTYVFDFGRNEVRNFLVANALYWLEELHVDGLRVDAVASMLYLDYSRKEGEWLPNQYGGRENLDAVAFLQEMNSTVYERVPGITTIAEESTAWPGVSRPVHLGGLGFGFKWNMGWMHDSLDYVAREPVYRGYHHHQMTFSMVYAYSENYTLPISHDEVVHGKGSLLRKMPGDRWQQLANVRAYLAFMWAHPGKQLLFQGQEFAQESEWSEERSLDWWLLDLPDHRGVALLVKELNEVYKATPALWTLDHEAAGFAWIDAERRAPATCSRSCATASDGSALACISNFAGQPHEGYRLGLPWAGTWREVVNTDAEGYYGSGVGNGGSVEATGEGWHGQPAVDAAARPAARHRLARQRRARRLGRPCATDEPRPRRRLRASGRGPSVVQQEVRVVRSVAVEVEVDPAEVGFDADRLAGSTATSAATSTTGGSPAGRCVCPARTGRAQRVCGQRDKEAGLPVEATRCGASTR